MSSTSCLNIAVSQSKFEEVTQLYDELIGILSSQVPPEDLDKKLCEFQNKLSSLMKEILLALTKFY